MQFSGRSIRGADQLHIVTVYAAQLELEVDRLRRRDQFLQHECREHVRQLSRLSKGAAAKDNPDETIDRMAQCCDDFTALLRDVSEPPGYHPAYDQVVSIAIRPLAEQIFRWQQRLSGAANAILRLDLQPEHIDWFPGRLRHILDNLISNALRFRDPSKGEIRVGIGLRVTREGYELCFTDNGVGISGSQSAGMLELFYRAAPAREAGLGVGLAVVKFMVEECCGTISVASTEGQGTSVTVVLPRYDLDDYLA